MSYSFEKNPGTWLAIAAALYIGYHHYQRGQQLDLVCQLLWEYEDWPATTGGEKTVAERAVRICVDRASDTEFDE